MALAAALASASAEAGAPERRSEPVTVMTRNVYIGADLAPLTQVSSFDELKSATADILEEVVRTDFPARAALLADEIDRARPDLVGLQEVVHYRFDREDPDGAGPLDGPARETFQDFLSILLAELNAGAGPRYRIAARQEQADIELPIEDRAPGASDPDFDARATIHDVVLARRGAGVRTSDPQGANFVSAVSFDAAGIRVPVRRGWTSVVANVRGARFLLLNTHLEAFDAEVRRDQARELVRRGGPARSELPVVLIGDVNSDDDSVAGADRLAYRVLTRAGFAERQTPDFSCCYSAAMNDPAEVLDHTVDHVLVDAPAIGLGRSYVTGDDAGRRTSSGLWPSDHGGVVSVLRIPVRG